MTYRPDIQLLRGLAVLLVVLFHLDLAGFHSGFLGVDVFFVISGYLMAVLYDPADWRGFFRRRARRLLPAYYVTIIATLAVAAWRTTPNDFTQVLGQSRFATVFASNVGYWLENSYFDHHAFKPLLHLWSLGVEIQFYLFVPLLAWLLRRSRLAWPLLLAGSALACFWLLGISPKTSFFMMPMRLWQFLIGFGVASRLRGNGFVPAGRTTWPGLAGLLAILAIPLVTLHGDALGFVDGHPGLVSLGITLASAATLLWGIPRALVASPAGAALERLGGWSYSIYLAHFPVIVLGLYRPFSGTVLKAPDATATALLAAGIAAASALLYLGIERPLRHLRPVAKLLLAAAAATLLAGVVATHVQAAFVPPALAPVYGAWTDRAPYRCGKIARLLHPRALTCELTSPDATATAARLLLVGNSHADALKTAFVRSAAARHARVWFTAANDPLMPGGPTPAALVDEARRQGVTGIVLHFSPGALKPDALRQTAALAAANGIRLALILPVPVWEQNVPEALWRARTAGAALPQATIDDYRNVNAELLDAAAGVPDLPVYATAGTFCTPQCALVTRDDRPIWFDTDHLTLSGAALLGPTLDAVVRDITAAR